MKQQVWSALTVMSAMAACAAANLIEEDSRMPTGHMPSIPKRRLRLRQRRGDGQVHHDGPQFLALDAASHRSSHRKVVAGERAVVTLDVASAELQNAVTIMETDAAAIRAEFAELQRICAFQYVQYSSLVNGHAAAEKQLQSKIVKNLEEQGQVTAEVQSLKKTADSDLLSYQSTLEQDHRSTSEYTTAKAASEKELEGISGIFEMLQQKRAEIQTNDTESLDYILGVFKGMNSSKVKEIADLNAKHATENNDMTTLANSQKQTAEASNEAYMSKLIDKMVVDNHVRNDVDEKDLHGFLRNGELTIFERMGRTCGPEKGAVQASIGALDDALGTLRNKVQHADGIINGLPNLQVPDLLQIDTRPMEHMRHFVTRSPRVPGRVNVTESAAVNKEGAERALKLHKALFEYRAGVSQRANSFSGHGAKQTPDSTACHAVKQQYAGEEQFAKRQHAEAKVQANMTKSEIAELKSNADLGKAVQSSYLTGPYQIFSHAWTQYQGNIKSPVFRSVDAKADIDTAIADVNNYKQNGGPYVEANDLLSTLAQVKTAIDAMVAGNNRDMATVSTEWQSVVTVFPDIINQISLKVAGELAFRRIKTIGL